MLVFVAYIYKLQIVIRADFVKLGRNFLFVDNGLVCFLNVDKDRKVRHLGNQSAILVGFTE